MYSYVAFSGNIGAGKTTCAKALASLTSAHLLEEEVLTNPYLERFYSQPQEWAFRLQMFNLASRSNMILEAMDHGPLILDRSFEEDILFVDLAHERGLVDSVEYGTYRNLYAALLRALPRPTMLVYVRAPSIDLLLARISARGRQMERTIDHAYLRDLQRKYESWIDGYSGPKVVVDATASHEEVAAMLAQA